MKGPRRPRVLVLSGGVGGAKLVHGFALLGSDVDLSVAVNVGDDFEHLGLAISPDIDTVLYTLAGLSDRDRGWGLADETWRVLDRLTELGGDSWFRLGDKDLATHLYRTAALRSGRTLSDVTMELANQLQVSASVFPATDDPVRTQLATRHGLLDFQDYFVRRRCEPTVSAIAYAGASTATPSKLLSNLCGARDDAADIIVLAPSNPFLSVAPVLAIGGLCESIKRSKARVVAVSPIVGGKAIKGPTAKLMNELGLPVSAAMWANYMSSTYPGLIDDWIFDEQDEADAASAVRDGLRARTAQTIMRSDNDRVRLARQVLG